MLNEELEFMKLRPGRYAVSDKFFKFHGIYVRVEVDEGRVIHQLNKDGERDGVLSDEGWDPGATVYAIPTGVSHPTMFVRLKPPTAFLDL